MSFRIMSYIFSKRTFIFNEINLNNLHKNWEDDNSITFEKYDHNNYEVMKYTLTCIKENERYFTMDEVKNRIEEGQVLYVAKDKGKIIGFTWVGFQCIDVPFFQAKIYLNNDEVVMYNTYVLEEYRGKRIFPKLKGYAFKDLIQKGYKRKLGYIQTTNISSLKQSKNTGEIIIGKLTLLIILTLEFHYNNLLKYKIVFHGGPLRLWKGLFRKIKDKYLDKIQRSVMKGSIGSGL